MVGETLAVHISSVTHPGNFSCQLAQPSVEDLPLLMDKIHSFCSQAEELPCPEELRRGMASLARSREAMWSRAEVVDKDDPVEVMFVDYGTVEHVARSSIRRIPADLVRAPRMTLCCSLHGVESVGKEWDEESAARFRELLACEGSTLEAKVMAVQRSGDARPGAAGPVTFGVTLLNRDSDSNIADVLVSGGYAKRPEVG